MPGSQHEIPCLPIRPSLFIHAGPGNDSATDTGEAMKWKARVEYRAVVNVVVEADTMKEAEEKAVEEADDGLSGTVTVYGIDIEPA